MAISNIEVWSVLNDIEKVLVSGNPFGAMEGVAYLPEANKKGFGEVKLNRAYTPEQIKAMLEFKEAK